MGMDTTALQAGSVKAQGSLAGLGVSAKTLGSVVPLAMGAAAIGIAKFAADAVGAASDLTESVNKVKVVFGESSNEILEWGETTADSIGISEQSALEAAGTFGNLFDAMGLAQDAGTEMSMTLVELAADLASFNNASPEDVLAAMQSGLTGQIRPLRQYGIEISEAALKQEALAQGITKSTSQMTMAEKVQLRYALILKQTGNAQGDFARTSDDLANMQRRLKAQWEDVTAQLGMLLLPVVLSVTSALNDLATVILFLTGAGEGWNEEVEQAIINTAEWELGIADFAIRATNGIPIIGHFVNTTEEISAAMAAAGEATGLTQAQLALLAGQIGANTPAFENYRQGWLRVVDGFLGFVHDAPEVVNKVERVMSKIPKVFRDTAEALLGEIPAIRGTITSVKEAFDISPKELQAITHHWATIARTIAHDLRVLGDSDLKPAMREAIAALPPEMRHAWVEGNARQRNAIESSIKTTYKIEDQMPALAKQALAGGKTVGTAFDNGIAAGIESFIPFITAAAHKAVQAAIDEARATAKAESPSKKMAELGADMMEGLVQGMLKGQNALLAAAEKVMTALQDKLSSMVSKASSFGQGIEGGFSSLMGFPSELPEGQDLQGFFQEQLRSARMFADTLKALQTQGAGKGLLGEIASQGPGGITMAQQLLQGGPEAVGAASKAFDDIAAIAEKTADTLTNSFFGERIADLRHDVKDQKDVLVDIKQNVKFLEKISGQLSSGEGGHITINAGALLGTREEVMDWIRQGLVAAGRSGKGHH